MIRKLACGVRQSGRLFARERREDCTPAPSFSVGAALLRPLRRRGSRMTPDEAFLVRLRAAGL